MPEDAWFFLDPVVEIVPIRGLGIDLKRPHRSRTPIIFYNRRKYAGLRRRDQLRIIFKFLRRRLGWWHASAKLSQILIDLVTLGYSGGRNDDGKRLTT